MEDDGMFDDLEEDEGLWPCDPEEMVHTRTAVFLCMIFPLQKLQLYTEKPKNQIIPYRKIHQLNKSEKREI